MGPDFSIITPVISTFGEAASVQLDDFINLQNGVYWAVLYGVHATCFSWVVLWICIYLQVNERWRSWVANYLVTASYLLLPIIGNLGFLPILSILMSVYFCPYATGSTFADSLLEKDCYQHCWTQQHSILVSFSLLSLVLYIPLAVLMRPAWQELQPNLHIKTLPMYLMLKSVFQVNVAVLSKTLKTESRTAHGLIYLGALICFFAFIMKVKPFNYERANLWLKVSMIMLIWSTMVLVVNELATVPISASLGICLGGWGLIFLGFLLSLRRLPLLLTRPKGKDTKTLFRFAFTAGKGIDIEKMRNKLTMFKPEKPLG
mmetsp:Transcript_12924/g.24005  ORF Transcript_12924/g.24005 Transcript_12924/m.24005 type:complete len:317 (+) Transcript_12924:705-1655(+)